MASQTEYKEEDTSWLKNRAFWITVILAIKMALLRHLLFSEVEWLPWLGDLAGVAALASLLELLPGRRLKPLYFWGMDVLLSLVLFAAALYYQHFGSVVTYTSLHELKQIGQIKSDVKATIEPIDYLFFLDFLMAIPIIWALRRERRRDSVAPPVTRPARLPRPVAALLLLAGVGYGLWSIRGAEATVNELKQAEELGFFNYEAFVAWNQSKKDTEHFASPADVAKAVRKLQKSYPYQSQPLPAGATPAHFGDAKGANVIVVQLEAFQNFPVHLSLNGQVMTPVLNALADGSYYFPHIFQQIGPGNTSDAEFMSNTSIYPTGMIPMSTGYGDRSLPSFPKLLEGMGFQADTFHVNDVTFWDRNKLYPAIGFSHYFDRPFYVNDKFNEFGASDVNLYKGALQQIEQAGLGQPGKPFYAQMITVSSHYPFKIPEQYQTLTLPESIKGKQLGDYLQAIHYTDYALGTLIAQLKAAGLWDNALFIAYGDHFGLQPQDNDPKEVSEALGISYHPQLSRFNIPLVIHVPGQTEGKVVDQVGGQLDIVPTEANLLGIPLDKNRYLHFGQDLLNIDHNVFGMRYYLPTGSFFNNHILFMPGKGFADGTAFDIRTQQPVADFSQYRSDFDYVMQLMKLSDEFVKLLPKR